MNVGVFIGRFQPLHVGHISIIAYMQKQYDHLVILVGSANQRPSTKNPFSFEQRKAWLEHSFADLTGANTTQKISVLPLNDYRYNEKKWEAELNRQVLSATTEADNVTLVGYEKDDSSYYLKSFSQWGYDEVPQSVKISATPIRTAWFNDSLGDFDEFLPPYVAEFLTSKIGDYQDIFDEYSYFEAEKIQYKDYPYPETLKFCCADAVVTCDGYILLIKRGNIPGKGCWALPGGYVNRGEDFASAARRELAEETGIDDSIIPKKSKAWHLFDAPKRSFGIDRISVAHWFVLEGKRPNIAAGDDAADAKWVKFSHIKNMILHDDHGDIVDHFLDIM